MLKKILLAAVIASSFAAVPLTSIARTIVIREAPPAPREEAVPAPRRGYAWAPGHYEWRGGHHVWVSGNWLRARRGQHWEAPQWVERNGQWEMRQGRWARGDRDGDGVPNRMDRAPNNPNKS
ncbi:MAG: hypothetical protein JWQ07_1485 [Ramlibacter sp.]|nr:hypothetical protein [Ramlibacter sp.]